MARPAPTVIMSAGSETGFTTEILKGKGIWTLTYNGEPVQLREQFFDETGMRYHYPRCTYNNPAHCYNLAKKMNEQFGTTEFRCQKFILE